MEINSDKIDWINTEKQLSNRNITGRSLKNFNHLVFELIGIQDFDIVTHLVSEIQQLKKRYDVKGNQNDCSISKMSDIPKEYLCPITNQIMTDPVMAFDGHSYEKNAIESYLKIHKKSPITGATADIVMVFPNHKLKIKIQTYIKNNNIDLEELNRKLSKSGEGNGNET
eukprot:373857_1